MAKINIRIAQDGTIVPVEEINLDQVTNTQLIQEMVSSGQIQAPAQGHEYRLAGKNNEILTETVTLKEAGFKDGDTVTLLDKGIGANFDGSGTDADDGPYVDDDSDIDDGPL